MSSKSISVIVAEYSRVLASCRLVIDGLADSTVQEHTEAAAALLAADGGLRAALAEGLALFALAAARPDGTATAAGRGFCPVGRLAVLNT